MEGLLLIDQKQFWINLKLVKMFNKLMLPQKVLVEKTKRQMPLLKVLAAMTKRQMPQRKVLEAMTKGNSKD